MRRWHDDGGDLALYHGDALGVLRDLPADTFDAVIADPPYSSGGQFRSDRNRPTSKKYLQSNVRDPGLDFQGDNRDQRSYLAWCSLWLAECLRVLKPGRLALVFTDWRQLPITMDALQAGGFVWRGVISWDKGAGARPTLGFNARAEFLAWGSRGPIDLAHRVYLDGVIRAPVRRDEKYHQTGKPVGLLERLLQVVPPGGSVLDPFCGSGSTLVAARRLGMRATGVEIDERFLRVARDRVAQRSLLEAA